jgi:putative nucleic acid binding, OB-fold, tRNA/helicase-type
VTAGRRELSGTVTAITYPGLGSSPVLRMSMRTGDGTVTLAFLGRRDIHCIEVGSSLRVRGILAAGRRGAAILYNPDYTVTPRGKDDG